MSVKIIIDQVNQNFKNAFASIPGAMIYGLSELIQRKDKDGKLSVLPYVINHKGEGTYVGYDDKNPLIIYHRLNTANQIERVGSSYGDDRTDQITTYNNYLYVYADRRVVCSDQSRLLELVETNLPDYMPVSGYKNVILRVTNVNFNTQTILKGEYQGQIITMKPERVLVQIYYQIETTFRKKCMERCA